MGTFFHYGIEAFSPIDSRYVTQMIALRQPPLPPLELSDMQGHHHLSLVSCRIGVPVCLFPPRLKVELPRCVCRERADASRHTVGGRDIIW